MLLCRDMPMAAVAEGLGEHDTGSFSTSNSASGSLSPIQTKQAEKAFEEICNSFKHSSETLALLRNQ